MQSLRRTCGFPALFLEVLLVVFVHLEDVDELLSDHERLDPLVPVRVLNRPKHMQLCPRASRVGRLARNHAGLDQRKQAHRRGSLFKVGRAAARCGMASSPTSISGSSASGNVPERRGSTSFEPASLIMALTRGVCRCTTTRGWSGPRSNCKMAGKECP